LYKIKKGGKGVQYSKKIGGVGRGRGVGGVVVVVWGRGVCGKKSKKSKKKTEL
jgi:hypothetical protein